VFDHVRPLLTNHELYADKAYQCPDAQSIEAVQELTVLTPVKKEKGQCYRTFGSMVFNRRIARSSADRRLIWMA